MLQENLVWKAVKSATNENMSVELKQITQWKDVTINLQITLKSLQIGMPIDLVVDIITTLRGTKTARRHTEVSNVLTQYDSYQCYIVFETPLNPSIAPWEVVWQ
jgi:hypothetical protein